MTEVRRAAPLPALFAKSLVTSRFGGSALPADGGRLTLSDVGIDNPRLDAYQRLCGFGIGDDVPSTFLHVLGFPLATEIMAARQFPLPLVGLVHVENRIEQLRPVQRGETVSFEVHAADLRPHRSGRQVDLVTTVTSAGEPVMRESSTYLHREKSPARTSAPTAAPGVDQAGGVAGDANTDGNADAAQNARPAGAESAVADSTAEIRWRVPSDIGRRYAAVSGDANPIHMSALSARAFGFPRAIAHGMWVAARTLSALEYRLPPAYVQTVSFKKPVLLPTTVRFAAPVEAGGWSLAVTSVKNGAPHLTGTLLPAPSMRGSST